MGILECLNFCHCIVYNSQDLAAAGYPSSKWQEVKLGTYLPIVPSMYTYPVLKV